MSEILLVETCRQVADDDDDDDINYDSDDINNENIATMVGRQVYLINTMI